jgi:oxalate---CoA ligase
LVYFHGDLWGGSYVNKLARLLGPDQPILVIAPHGTRDDPIPNSIEAMAADRLSLITKAQPHGPYRLCGYCMGGLVAFEVARLLVAAGKRVELVAMIDAPTFNARRSFQMLFSVLNRVRPNNNSTDFILAKMWRYVAKLDRFLNSPRSKRWVKLSSNARNFVAAARHYVCSFWVEGEKAKYPAIAEPYGMRSEHFYNYFQGYAIAMSRYLPRPLPLKVIFFSAEYDGEAWRRVSRDLEAFKLSDDHYRILTDPVEVAAHLRAFISKKDG